MPKIVITFLFGFEESFDYQAITLTVFLQKNFMQVLEIELVWFEAAKLYFFSYQCKRWE